MSKTSGKRKLNQDNDEANASSKKKPRAKCKANNLKITKNFNSGAVDDNDDGIYNPYRFAKVKPPPVSNHSETDSEDEGQFPTAIPNPLENSSSNNAQNQQPATADMVLFEDIRWA